MAHGRWAVVFAISIVLSGITTNAFAFTARSGAASTFTGQIGYDDPNTRAVNLNRAILLRNVEHGGANGGGIGGPSMGASNIGNAITVVINGDNNNVTISGNQSNDNLRQGAQINGGNGWITN